MKKTILLLIAVAINSLSFAQKNCKYTVNELDKFTKKMVKQTKSEQIVSTWDKYLYFSARKEADDVNLIFEYWECWKSKREMVKITPGLKLMLLLEDGSIVELLSVSEITGAAKNYPTAIPPTYCSVLYDVKYSVPADAIEKLLSNTITTLRFYRTEGNGNTGYLDFEIKKKNSDDIIELLKCVL
jgi:hypothetical protein